MELVVQQDAVGQVRFVRCPRPHLGNRRLRIVSGIGKGIAEIGSVKKGLGKDIEGVGDVGGVHQMPECLFG